MHESFWHLKRCELFQRLSEAEVQRLERCSRARSFPSKSPIYLPADDRDAVYLLASGRAKICHLTEDGKMSILAFIDTGELFGELRLIDPGERDEYVEAVEESTVVMVPAAEVRRLMEEYPHVSLSITKLIGLRRKRVERRLKQLLFHSNRHRVIHLLLDLAEQYGSGSPQQLELRIRLSHQDLANVIGSTRETVTVVLGRLQAEGFLQVRRQRITLLQPQRLANTVEREMPQLQRTAPNVWPAQFARAAV